MSFSVELGRGSPVKLTAPVVDKRLQPNLCRICRSRVLKICRNYSGITAVREGGLWRVLCVTSKAEETVEGKGEKRKKGEGKTRGGRGRFS